MWLIILGICLCLSLNVKAQACNEERSDDGKLYSRVLIMYSSGNGSTHLAYRADHQDAYGSCRDLDQRAQQMTQFFASFGFNMSSVEAAPFEGHTTDDFTLTPLHNPFTSTQRIMMGSFYEYAEFMNAAVKFGSWGLTVKRDRHGPKGRIPAGSLLLAGVYSFIMDGRVQCVDYQRGPQTNWLGKSDKYSPVLLDLYNEEWGPGKFLGLFTSLGNGLNEFRAVLSF